MHEVITMFLILAGFHFLCDYPLQGDFLAMGKSSFDKPHFGIPWWHCNFAHAAIHGLAVGLVTKSVTLGLCELACHFAIDYGKSKKWFDINSDQILHLVCKALWAFVATSVVVQWMNSPTPS